MNGHTLLLLALFNWSSLFSCWPCPAFENDGRRQKLFYTFLFLTVITLQLLGIKCYYNLHWLCTDIITTVLRPFFQDHPGEPVPEENFWTTWCKGRLTEADTLTIRLGATPSGLTSARLHHPPIFFTGRMLLLPPNQRCQSTEGNQRIRISEKTLEFSSVVLPAPSPYLIGTDNNDVTMCNN